jgi:hypothetical protein
VSVVFPHGKHACLVNATRKYQRLVMWILPSMNR